MTTLYITHSQLLDHAGPPGHPERPDRLRALKQVFDDPAFATLVRLEAPPAELEAIARVHPMGHIEYLRKAEPSSGFGSVDADTYLCPGSFEAARRACGAVILAVDKVMGREADNAFCAVRPPGHHAEKARAMGFCLFNSVAVAARHAREVHGLSRIAIVDFDVHHGNGTQEIFWEDRSVLYASTHQMPLYPGSGSRSETGVGNIFNAPLRPGDGSEEFRAAMDDVVLPAVDRFGPDLILVSAGFDAHVRDPLAQLQLTEEDFAWATLKLMDLARRHASGRLVSALEGGYDLTGLARSAALHVATLMRG